MHYNSSLEMHRLYKGKLRVASKVPLENKGDLSLAYSPGVAEPCSEIAKDVSLAYDYTIKGNFVAVVTDGTAVLGLGDIGPEAALPVMEGKALLLKRFADIDAVPICLDTKDPDEIIRTVKLLSPTFGAVNLEDISAPRCFEIEERLREEMTIPVFHDDQHGTAIVVGAGLLNALNVVEKEISDVQIVVNGAGAAGISIVRMLNGLGFQHVVMCDTRGIIYEGRSEGLNPIKESIAKLTNFDRKTGSLRDAMIGADIFIGVSAANLLDEEMIQSMNPDPIVFALANPIPEIMPDLAKYYGVRIIATGRSDFPNQVNNVLAFPGIFRGALDIRATDINDEMKIAATYAIASLIDDDDLNEDYIIPDPFDERVVKAVAEAVKKAAFQSGVADIRKS